MLLRQILLKWRLLSEFMQIRLWVMPLHAKDQFKSSYKVIAHFEFLSLSLSFPSPLPPPLSL